VNNFLRISTVYPNFLKDFYNNQYDKNENYEVLLEKFFSKNYSISNNLTKELTKLDYNCIEIIENANLIQKQWLKQYGKVKSDESILLQQIKFYNPNIIFIGNANLANNILVEKIKKNTNVKIIICFHCAPLTKKIINNLGNVDGIVTCTEGYKEIISKKINDNVLLLRHAYNNKELNVKNVNRNIDITFVGSIFIKKGLHSKRVSLIYKLMKNFNNVYVALNFSKYFYLEFLINFTKSIFFFKIHRDFSFFYKLIYIHFFCKKAVFGDKMLDILKKTKILINTHIDDTEYAGNMRLFEGTGMGCLVITDYKKNLDEIFNIKSEIEVFNSIDELISKCSYYLNNQGKLFAISKKGKLRTLLDHNYEKRIFILDRFIKELQSEKNI